MTTFYSRRHNLLFPLTKWFPPCRKKHWEVWEHFWVVVGLYRSRNVESVNKSEMVHSFNIKIVFCTGVSECVRFFSHILQERIMLEGGWIYIFNCNLYSCAAFFPPEESRSRSKLRKFLILIQNMWKYTW